MSFSLAPFLFALSQAVQLHSRVACHDELITRPLFVRKAVAARLRAGIRALTAFLRRILILMALEIEHELVAKVQTENLARAKAPMPPAKKPFLLIYPKSDRPQVLDFQRTFGTPVRSNLPSFDASSLPVTVPIGRWLAQLDHLHKIALDPLAKARRLAFSLARSHHGILMAPPEHPRIMRRHGREATAIYDAMAAQIMHKSRSRPPPLPPPWRGPKPMITVFYNAPCFGYQARAGLLG